MYSNIDNVPQSTQDFVDSFFEQSIPCPLPSSETDIQARLYRRFAHVTTEDIDDMSEEDHADYRIFLAMMEEGKMDWLLEIENALTQEELPF